MKKLTTIFLIILVSVNALFSLDVNITKSGLIYSNHIFYDLGYSYEHNMALWSKYTLDSEKLENVVPRPKKRFILDTNLPKRTVTHDDYTKSLIKEMELCQSGRSTFTEYEKLCYKLLKNIFMMN